MDIYSLFNITFECSWIWAITVIVIVVVVSRRYNTITYKVTKPDGTKHELTLKK